jgi:hypothetical protein
VGKKGGWCKFLCKQKKTTKKHSVSSSKSVDSPEKAGTRHLNQN